MLLQELVDKLGLIVRTQGNALNKEITGGYAGDLLSDVMANGNPGNVWVTIQIHANIIAVATLKELAGIIITNNRNPEPETIEKAEREKIPILVSTQSTFEIVGRMYQLINKFNATTL